ncbi:unnamed protein product [Adineta ricciae]|uniref:Uncharacterized protein n=1 Tax=Adineta ricciae TaxID=249248 RepID=A0A815RJD7_ADIRI|nr:unnamed protein product [Adineta ricciae]
MVDSNDNVGIIILGNNNSEKSFLGNVILKRELLQHKYQELSFLGQSYIVYNIPSLIEAEQERIDLNKREIYTFFQQHPRSIVLFVFGEEKQKIQYNKWKENGIIVAGGNGQGNGTNQLNFLIDMIVDDKQSIYVLDLRNNRIMKWIKDSNEGRDAQIQIQIVLNCFYVFIYDTCYSVSVYSSCIIFFTAVCIY